MGNRRVILPLVAIAVLVPLLAGCQPDEPVATNNPSAKPSASATPTPTPTATPEASGLVTPTNCEEMLGAALLAKITAGKTVLFSSSDGTGIYPNDPKQPGGFQCEYGVDQVDYSTFEFDVQELTEQSHADVLAQLDASGMPKSVDGNVVTYSQVGDEGSKQLYLQVVRPDSWITGWASFGGQKQFELISGYVATIGQQLYPAP